MRFIAITTLGLIIGASAYANQFQLGGTNGLTTSYVTAGCATANGPSFSGCVAGGSSTFGTGTAIFQERGYLGTLFAGATVGGANPTLPTGGSSVTVTDPQGGGNVQLNYLNEGSNSAWNAVGNSVRNGTLTIPVGLYAPTEVFTMLQNFWGVVGTQTIEVSFNFGATSNAASGLTTENYFLTNGKEVRAGIDCVNPPSCPTTIASTLSASSYANVASVNAFSTLYDGIIPSTGTALSGGAKAAAGSPFVGASMNGYLDLDVQSFKFGGTYASQYLVSIVVTDLAGTTGVGNTTNVTRTDLSAITVNTLDATTTPEPGTILLALAGIGTLGVARWRRRRS